MVPSLRCFKRKDRCRKNTLAVECQFRERMPAWSSGLSENVRLCVGSVRKSTGRNHQHLSRSRKKEWPEEVRIEG